MFDFFRKIFSQARSIIGKRAANAAGKPADSPVNQRAGPRPDAALRLAATAWELDFTCTVEATPSAHDRDALERCRMARSGGRKADQFHFPTSPLEWRTASVHVVWDQGNLAQAIGRCPARVPGHSQMLHILLPEYGNRAAVLDRITSSSLSVADLLPLAPRPLGSVAQWSSALRRAAATPQGFPISDLDAVFLSLLPPGIEAGLSPRHPQGAVGALLAAGEGGAVAMNVQVRGDGRVCLSVPPAPSPRGLVVTTWSGDVEGAPLLAPADHGLIYAAGTALRIGGKSYRIDQVDSRRVNVHHEEPAIAAARRRFRFHRTYEFPGDGTERLEEATSWCWSTAKENDFFEVRHFHLDITRTTKGHWEEPIAGPEPAIYAQYDEPVRVDRRFVSVGEFRLPARGRNDLRERAESALHFLFPDEADRCAVGIIQHPDPFGEAVPTMIVPPADSDVASASPDEATLFVIEDSDRDLGVVRALIGNTARFSALLQHAVPKG
jgi:hypothetical protein